MRYSRVLFAALVLVPSLLAGGARAQQMRVASNTTTAAPPALDSAITSLQEFLTRYPDSPLRPNALFELGELLVRRADEQFAETQRAGEAATPGAGDTTARPSATPPRLSGARAAAAATIGADYSTAIARYEELITRYPNFEQIDAAEYTLGTLYSFEQNYAAAANMFQRVAAQTNSSFRPEALFRLGDARFELASREKGDRRRALFGDASQAYEQAVAVAPPQGDIYFLSLYKLGWSYYNQANQANQQDYQRAVDVFGRLVDAYDKLTPEQQARLGLRGEAIEYMAIAFTQVGGSEAANRYFTQHGGAPYKTTILRRVAQSLRDQGNFPEAIRAYQTVLSQAPTDSSVLDASREIVDIYQNRMIQLDSAQTARLDLVQRLAPGSAWAQANPQLADSAAAVRQDMLRQAGQYELAAAQAGNRARFAQAAQLYEQYLKDYPKGDSAQIVNRYYAEALFGAGDYARSGAEFSRTAYGYGAPTNQSQEAGRNAIVAFDSALVRNKNDRAAQDSLFAAVDQFAATFPNTDVAKKALIEKGRRASETQRWDVMAQTFRTYAEKYPNDPYTPTAQRLIGDALYRGGQYSQAQQQWEQAQQVASTSGRTALADTIAKLRTSAAEGYADSLIKAGNYKQAAEEVYVAYAKNNPQSAKAPDALRNAIETYMLADSTARAHNDQGASNDARQRAIELSAQLAQQYPNYKYRLQYQTLRARLLSETGKQDQAVQAYQELIAQNPQWNGRADAMVRVAVMLDSLGRKPDAAAAYEAFANAYPRDNRAAGALWNAAVTYADAKDFKSAARAYATFAQRYPRDDRAAQARAQQVAMLQSAGDSTAANAALASACSRPSDELKAECAGRVAERAFAGAVSTFKEYQPIKMVLTSRTITAAAVKRASARKQTLLKELTGEFSDAIKSGVPQYIAAGSYYVGLAQWEYGEFLKNVQLPAGLTDEQKTAAQQAAAQQAEQYYAAAKQVWSELVQKAESTPEIQKDPKAASWVQRARDAVQGKVDTSPPTVTGD